MSAHAPRPTEPADSVPLGPGPPAAPWGAPARGRGLKLLLALFVLFVLVVSDTFTNGVLAGFGEKAVRGRRPTAWGTVLQGIALVVGYAVAAHLISSGVL